jgi:hypothetical protein
MAAKDSAWAAALHTAGPVFIAIAVLAFGCSVVWMLTRSADRDAELANVLVEEIAGHGTGVLFGLSGTPGRSGLRNEAPAGIGRSGNLIDIKPGNTPPPDPDQDAEPHHEPKEMPF